MPKKAGQAVEVVYPVEGKPSAAVPWAIFMSAPNPNAACLLQSHLFSGTAQQLLVDSAALRSVRRGVKDKAGRTPPAIKPMKHDPFAVDAEGEGIKQRYVECFLIEGTLCRRWARTDSPAVAVATAVIGTAPPRSASPHEADTSARCETPCPRPRRRRLNVVRSPALGRRREIRRRGRDRGEK